MSSDISEIRFKKSPDFVTRKVFDELVIVPVANSVAQLDSVFTLDGIGTEIWDLIDGKTGTNRIIGLLQDMFDAPPSDIERDVTHFLMDLERAGLIVRSDG